MTTVALSPAPPYWGPSPALYAGGSVAQDVPWKWPVAVDGRPYMLDLASEQFQRGWEPRLRDSVDQGGLPGEASISPEGMWRRAQASWHVGAGQRWADADDSVPGRFWRSVGVDPWTRNELRLLPATEELVSSTEAQQHVISDGVRLYVAQGDTVVYYTTLSGSATTVTGTPAADVVSVATNGYTTWFSHGASGVYRANRAGDAAASAITGTVGVVGFARNRLLVANGASLYDCTSIAYGSASALPSALFTHANTDFTWVGFAAGPQHIYAAGYSGRRSLIYRISITAEGTGLGAPTVALELPPGEQVYSVGEFPGGFILIGTSAGARLAVAGADGSLTVGAAVDTDGPVRCFTADETFVWFGWSEHTSGLAGVGRMDLREFSAPVTPAYASDLYGGDGLVTSVTRHLGKTVYAVSVDGIYAESDDLLDDGWLDTGQFVWGVPDPKVVAKVDIRTYPLPEFDSVQVEVTSDNGTPNVCQCSAQQGAVFLRFHPLQRQSYQTNLRVRLFLSDDDESPVVTRVNMRAFVAPSRSQVIRVPLLLHHTLNVNGEDVPVDVRQELFFLRGLVASPRLVTYQEGFDQSTVLVEDVLWVPRHEQVGPGRWDGTAVVTMRSIEQV